MLLFTNNLMYDVFTIIAVLLTVLIFWIKHQYTYWEKLGIVTPKPTFFVGNLQKTFIRAESFGEFVVSSYKFFKSQKLKHAGIYIFFKPTYVPVDPELIKNIMLKDFQHFYDRGMYLNEESDPLSAHLFSLEGTKWRNLRSKLSPAFTSGKLKMMFETIVSCGMNLITAMDEARERGPMEMKDMLSRFNTDVIGTVAFGIECNSLKDPDSEFRNYGDKIFRTTMLQNLKQMVLFIFPEFMKIFGAKIIPSDTSSFFLNVLRETVEMREKNNIHRKDFMHLLLQLKNRGELADDESIFKTEKRDKSEPSLSFNELAAQAFIFFLAGFETSSTTETFCLYELASNPDIQEKVRREVLSVLNKNNGMLTYDGILEMEYLDKVVNETLRKYPPLPSLNRACTKDYKVAGTDLTLKKGTKLMIPVLGLHHDEEYFPNPQIFDPERFSEENKRNRHPYCFLPFGEGPRICIGMRFGLMQTKIGICLLLKNYVFSVSDKTQVPLKMDPASFILTTQGGMWLEYKKYE